MSENVERRVRFTDEYVPGPEGCPVWGLETQWIFSFPVFIRAKTLNDAIGVYREYLDKHPGFVENEMAEVIKSGDYTEEGAEWLHLNADEGWGGKAK